jgi:hypothetical protein
VVEAGEGVLAGAGAVASVDGVMELSPTTEPTVTGVMAFTRHGGKVLQRLEKRVDYKEDNFRRLLDV